MALRNNFQSRVFLSFMKQISGVFFKKNMIAVVIWISKKTYDTQLTSFIQRVPHLPKTALPFRTNGPHGLDLIKKLFTWCPNLCPKKTIWGRMFWLLGPKKSEFPLNPVFFHRLNINRPFSQISIHPWRKMASILKGISLPEAGFAGNPCARRRDGRPVGSGAPDSPFSSLDLLLTT